MPQDHKIILPMMGFGKSHHTFWEPESHLDQQGFPLYFLAKNPKLF